MSVIIAICSINKCIFVADTRLVSIDKHDSISVKSENFEKIIKLNNNIVFGATGVFDNSETLLSAIDSSPKEYSILTLDSLLNSVKGYTEKNFELISACKNRTYLFGGRDVNTNKFYLCSIVYDSILKKFSLEVQEPSEDKTCVYLALPHNAKELSGEFMFRIQSAIHKENSKELFKELHSIISDISKIDMTVNNKVIGVCVE